MKLIVSELGAWRGYVSREFYFVMTDLMANYGWKHIETSALWNHQGTIRDKLLEMFGEAPEVILFWEGYHLLKSRAYEILRLDCRKCLFADDVHWRWREEGQQKFLCYGMCDTILSTYAYAFHRFYPQLDGVKRVAWVPHAASPDFMLPRKDDPENAILLSGSIGRYYPLRERMKRFHEERPYAVSYHPHPGYSCGYDYDNDRNVGRGYAATIQNYRVGFTDSSRYNYVVAKYFEIPATGALLLADGAVAPQLKELGLVEYRHYVPVSSDDLEAKIEHVLDERNHAEMDEVRRRGQQLIRERHKTSDRARLIDEICLA
jgi:hypothetical protein